jgi:hypothetical protein
MSLLTKTHKWKIRLGYLLTLLGGADVLYKYRHLSSACTVSASALCVAAHHSIKQALVALVAGVLLAVYGHIRRALAK